MPDPAVPNASLMRSLGRLVRGLSAIFWALPLTLLVCANNMVADWMRTFGVVAPMVTTGTLLFGIHQLGQFQPQERVWIHAVERARILAFVNLGLSPFVFWWNRLPDDVFFSVAVTFFFATSLTFLHNLNLAYERLTAMLPDETLRADTRLFTRLNRWILASILVFLVLVLGSLQFKSLPDVILGWINYFDQLRQWLITAAILPPVAMTMALTWKIREAILDSVFDARS